MNTDSTWTSKIQLFYPKRVKGLNSSSAKYFLSCTLPFSQCISDYFHFFRIHLHTYDILDIKFLKDIIFFTIYDCLMVIKKIKTSETVGINVTPSDSHKKHPRIIESLMEWTPHVQWLWHPFIRPNTGSLAQSYHLI